MHVVEYLGPSWSANLAFHDAALRKAYVNEKERAVAAARRRGAADELKAAFIAEAKARLPWLEQWTGTFPPMVVVLPLGARRSYSDWSGIV